MSTSHLAEAWRKAVEKADEAFVETQLHVQQGNERGVLWLEEKKAWSEELSTVEEQCSALEKGHAEKVAALQLESQLAVEAAFRQFFMADDDGPSTVGKPSAPHDPEVARLREELVEQRDLCKELHAVTNAAAAVRAIAGKKDAVIQELQAQLVSTTTNTIDAGSGKLQDLQHLDAVLQALASSLVSVSKSEETRSVVPNFRQPTVALSPGASATLPLTNPPTGIDAGNDWEGFVGKLRSEMGVLKQLSIERGSSITRLENEAATKAVDSLFSPGVAVMSEGKSTVPFRVQNNSEDKAGAPATNSSKMTPGLGTNLTAALPRTVESIRPFRSASSTTGFSVPARQFVNHTFTSSNITSSPAITLPRSRSQTAPRLLETPNQANLVNAVGVHHMGPGQTQTSHVQHSHLPQFNPAGMIGTVTPSDNLSVSQRCMPPGLSTLALHR